MRAALFLLLFVNLAFFAWAQWLAPRAAQLPASPKVDAPRLQLAVETGAVTALPDLRGYGAREAVHELVRLGLTPRVRGLGIVVSQDPEPGAPIEPGTACTLVLDRDPHAALVPGVPQ